MQYIVCSMLYKKMKPHTLMFKNLKSEIRISKFETNLNNKNQKLKTSIWGFEHLNFKFVSDFALRALNLFRAPALVIGTLKHTTYNIQHTTYNKGYALILSIVVSSVVLSIGLSLLNIVQKELILSATGRDSQFAFYAADSGVECALYWDIGYIDKKMFPANLAETSPQEGVTSPFPLNISSGEEECGETDFSEVEAAWSAEITDGTITFVPAGSDGSGGTVPASGYEDDMATYSFQIQFADATAESPGSCAKVTIIKQGNGETDPSLYKVNTTIDSKGYNAACPAGGGDFDADANPRLVERAISVSY